MAIIVYAMLIAPQYATDIAEGHAAYAASTMFVVYCLLFA